MTPLKIIIFTLTLGVFTNMAIAESATKSLVGSKPNIIVIMPDDIGALGLTQFGEKKNPYPHIESLFEKGISLTDFQVSPTCAPARAAFLTGRHEVYAGVTHTINMRDRMNLKHRLVSQVLKDAEYSTGIFGKWHLGDDDEYLPSARGFDEVYIHGAGGIGQNYLHSADFPNNDYNNPFLLHNNKVIQTKGYCTDLFFDQAILWMTEQHKKSTPFFCFIPTNVPHSPPIPPLKDDETYHPKEEILLNLNANVGKLLKYLEEQSMLEDTLIIYFSDNGGPSFSRLKGAKGSHYQGGSRVPCAMYWKGTLEGGKKIKVTTAHLDLYTTFAQLAGMKNEPVPGGKKWDGRNLLPLFQSSDAEWPDRYLITHKTRWKNSAQENQYVSASIRHGDYQLVWKNSAKFELYNLSKDLPQKNNIAADHLNKVTEMKRVYDQWWADVLPHMINDNIDVPKEHKPFHERYRKAFGEEAYQEALKKMDWVGGKKISKNKKKKAKTKSKSPKAK